MLKDILVRYKGEVMPLHEVPPATPKFDHYRQIVERQICEAYGVPEYMLGPNSLSHQLKSNTMQRNALKTKRNEIEAHLDSLTAQRSASIKRQNDLAGKQAKNRADMDKKIKAFVDKTTADHSKIAEELEAQCVKERLEVLALNSEQTAAMNTIAELTNQMLRS